ncbi:hypothetical protein VRRI112168_02340 [Vreelandella rituensis]|uniref:DUF4870 domain-containing protein n=1 Tax=Vreelandella rituensis TaxID=2282306 RepID=A0A368UAQ3_9GAMM|nr:hypothetical protein [Halomonas rituensis]RCV93587.1 hypothetical protein DU506_00080 [Halomonas rituensis]
MLPKTPSSEAPVEIQAPDKTNIKRNWLLLATYVLYLASPFIWFAPFVALIIGYVNRKGSGNLAFTHYHFQIRTFWLTFLVGIAGSVLYLLTLSLFISGNDVGLAWPVRSIVQGLTVWYYARMLVGIVQAARNLPIKNPRTWMF